VPITKKFKDMITAFANLLEQTPYSMNSAAANLRDWLSPNPSFNPLPDLSFCSLANAWWLAQSHPPVPRGPGFLTNGAIGFEPEVCSVSVTSQRAPQTSQPHSIEADFVHSVADGLVRNHAYTWTGALDVAERCWRSLLPRYRAYADGAMRPAAEAVPCDEEAVVETTPALQGDEDEYDVSGPQVLDVDQ
jgi:hypothetical protein